MRDWSIHGIRWCSKFLCGMYPCVVNIFCALELIPSCMQTTLCVDVDDGGKVLSARQIRDPETPNNPVALGDDAESGCKTNLQAPARAYAPRTRKGQPM